MIRRLAAILSIPLLSVVLLPTVACYGKCYDPDPDCTRFGGHFDEDCHCVEASHGGYPTSSTTAPPPPPPAPPSPVHCTSDDTCGGGNVCQHGICILPCGRDGDCQAHSVCFEGKCTSECAKDADCPAGFACSNQSFCIPSVATCANGEACSGDTVCDENGDCVAHCAGIACPYATTCVENSRCETPHARSCTTDANCHVGLGTCVNGYCVAR